jgi:ribosomal protein S18 acetylase RimI-like enzyme
MSMRIREAETDDVPFVADCVLQTARHSKSGASDPYARGLRDKPDSRVFEFARDYVRQAGRLALLAEDLGTPCGCLLGSIEGSCMPEIGLDQVGRISMCWVAPPQRRRRLALQLTAAAEAWFRLNGASVVELAYMSHNTSAAQALERLGYRPFRVFAYKLLRSDP